MIYYLHEARSRALRAILLSGGTIMDHEACGVCGREFPDDQLTEFDDQLLCPTCLEQETTICARCGDRIWNDDNNGDAHAPLCESCYDRFYTTCDRCGRPILYDNAYYEEHDEEQESPLCWSCYSQRQCGKHIHDYYYKPEPIFYGGGTRFFGVELEIDGAGESDSHARALMELANQGQEQRIYCKHDGSLDAGFEIVTHPMSLDYHLEQMPWPDILGEAKRRGYLSHQAGTCGLHIHVSRDALGAAEAEQDACIARILYFFEKHWEELLKFSRRTPRQLERWAARYGYKEHPKELLDHAKKNCRGDRYTCVNLQNCSTVEFRIFRGTLKYNTLIATLQMVDRICDVALHLSDDEIRAMSWTTFVSGCTAPELVQYLKERRLYVNEPVAGEEEV